MAREKTPVDPTLFIAEDPAAEAAYEAADAAEDREYWEALDGDLGRLHAAGVTRKAIADHVATGPDFDDLGLLGPIPVLGELPEDGDGDDDDDDGD